MGFLIEQLNDTGGDIKMYPRSMTVRKRMNMSSSNLEFNKEEKDEVEEELDISSVTGLTDLIFTNRRLYKKTKLFKKREKQKNKNKNIININFGKTKHDDPTTPNSPTITA